MRAARARRGIGAASLPRKVFHEEIRWQRFLIVREELDRSRLFTAREEKVHGLLCGFQVLHGQEDRNEWLGHDESRVVGRADGFD